MASKVLVAPVRLFDRRPYELPEFVVAVGVKDAVAPACGTRSLGEYFRRLAAGGPG